VVTTVTPVANEPRAWRRLLGIDGGYGVLLRRGL